MWVWDMDIIEQESSDSEWQRCHLNFFFNLVSMFYCIEKVDDEFILFTW